MQIKVHISKNKKKNFGNFVSNDACTALVDSKFPTMAYVTIDVSRKFLPKVVSININNTILLCFFLLYRK